MNFPSERIPASYPMEDEAYVFDANKHLRLEEPATVFDLASFKDIPHTNRPSGTEVAFAGPVHVLSEEGFKAFRAITDQYRKGAKRSHRQPSSNRGIPYRSKFIQDFVSDPTWLAYASKLAGRPLCPHSFGMHAIQVNYGKPGLKEAVDKWHLDSVDFVMVILLSDITDMVGGELQVYTRNMSGPEAAAELNKKGMDPEHIRTVSYDTGGMGIFCQGSRIFHRVSPVQSAREDRISMVVSFSSPEVFGEDRTRTTKFSGDPDNIVAWEMAKHVAWKASHRLNYIVEHTSADDTSKEEFAKILEDTAAYLTRGAGIVADKIDDHIGHVEEGKEKCANDSCENGGKTEL